MMSGSQNSQHVISPLEPMVEGSAGLTAIDRIREGLWKSGNGTANVSSLRGTS